MTATEGRGVLAAAVRFGAAGSGNTLITAALLSVLSHFIPAPVAYTVVFALGVAFSTVLAGRFVFRVRMSRVQTASYIGLYVAVYAIGLALIAEATARGLPPEYSGLVVLVTAPLTFVGGWLMLWRRRIEPKRQSLEDIAP